MHLLLHPEHSPLFVSGCGCRCRKSVGLLLPLVFVNEAPSGLIAKTKSNQSQGWEATLLEVLYSCLMFRYRWEGWCLRLKTSTFKPCHTICPLGSALDNVDGVKAGFLEPSFRLS
jgi:hypothetical protein